jgi:hypothetical protein
MIALSRLDHDLGVHGPPNSARTSAAFDYLVRRRHVVGSIFAARRV